MGTLKSYIVGFILSLGLTGTAFYLVMNQVLRGSDLLFAIFGLAIAQLLVQLIFFLHVGSGPDKSWNLTIFLSTLSIILTIVIGSVIIMNNLNYNHMTAEEMDKQLIEKEGIHR